MGVEFPLAESFFPQVVLNGDEIKYYKRLGKERLHELIRIAEDAELAYKWTDIRTPKMNTPIQKTQFLDMRPATKATFASTLIKCSVVISDTRPDEVLQAIARSKTKEYRKMMSHLHGATFMDGRTLFKFPSSIAATRPDYSYRAIKWCALKGKGDASKLDFSFLEYAGKKKPAPGSMVVGFCLQESIQRDREIPLLETYGFVRGYLSRAGIIVSKTHQPNVVRVTSICQIDGDIDPVVRGVLEGIMQDMVGAIVRMRGLLDRQRVSGMKFLAQFEWVANSDRKACAVCLKGFFFHRKHHCRACGEVVCSSCAPLRALDEPIHEIKELRICTSCMTKAGQSIAPEASHDRNNNFDTMTSDESSQSFNGHNSRGERRKNDSQEEHQYQEHESKDSLRRPSDAARMLLEKNRANQANRRRMTSIMKNPRETVDTITHIVDQIRDARETINVTFSEAGESRMSFGEDDAYNELYDQVSKLRDVVDMSVDGRNYNPSRGHPVRRPSAASSSGWRGTAIGTGNARSGRTPAATLQGEEEDRYDQHPDDTNRFSEETIEENLSSVLSMTFAAANATRAVGRAVLSSCASDHRYSDPYADNYHYDDHEEMQEIMPSPSEASAHSDNDPYSSSNYDRVMARLQASNADSLNTAYDDGYSNASASFRRQQPRRPQLHLNLRDSRVQSLEKKIQDLQRDLMDAHRKLSYFEVDDEPEPEFGGSGLGRVPEDHSDVEGSLVFRPSTGERGQQRSRRPSDASHSKDPRSEVRSSRQPPPPKPRAKSSTQLNASYPGRRSIDVGSMEHARRASEFTARPSTPGVQSRASSSGRAYSTAEQLSELRSVMNSSEVTRPTRRSSMMGSAPPSSRSSQRARSSSPSRYTRSSFSGMRPPPPPPPPSASAVTMYIDEKGRMRPATPSSHGSDTKPIHGLDRTASSSASYPNDELPSDDYRSSMGLTSSRYQELMDANPADDSDDIEEETSSDDNSIPGFERIPKRPIRDDLVIDTNRTDRDAETDGSFFGDQSRMDRAFVGQSVVITPPARPPSTSRGQSLQFVAPPLPTGSRPSMMAHDSRDELGELRELMENMATRPRSNSAPFRHALNEDPYNRPTHSDGAAVRHQSSAQRRESLAGDRYDQPLGGMYDAYSQRPSRPSRSGASPTPSQRTPRHMESAIAQVRACLGALHTECPSQWERHRKLQSISKIVRSLQKEGVRSKYRSLSHEDFQYERVLEETPSIVNLLRIAGYISQPDKLVMRNVDQAYLGVILKQIEDELHEMQATQDYL